MNPAVTEFLNRLPETAAQERELVATAFRFPETVRTKASEIRADGRLSDIGKSEAVKKLILEGGMAQHFAQIKQQVGKWQSDLQNARAALKPKAPDKADLSAAVQAWEIRTFLRSLPDAQRMRAALEEPSFASAIVHAPPVLSGLPADVHGLVVEAAIERELGPRIEAFREREQIVETVTAAMQVVEGQLRSEAGLQPGEL